MTGRPAVDRERVKEFAEQLLGIYTGGYLCFMIDIGHRLGLFDAAAQGPGTSEQLAARAGLAERQVREWLGALTAGRIFEYDPETRTYELPPERAACLAGSTPYNLAARSRAVANLAKVVPLVTQAFRDGGGVPYDHYRPEFTSLMDEVGRNRYDAVLISRYLPLADGLVDRLQAGIRVADIGCGTGHCVNLMAKAYRTSEFTGYDIASDALEQARREATALGLTNARFEELDAAQLPSHPKFDLITAFDTIHDQAFPDLVLRRIHDALAPAGLLVMIDIKASSHLEKNLDNPFAAFLYATSVMHCMQVSLAEGGMGLGTVWGEEVARRLLADAGFRSVVTHDLPLDPANQMYVCRP
jgi:2-polyprenyl-3-methyl-5-hydroxy-6-metoxy-1,4-benzoquinol methylase